MISDNDSLDCLRRLTLQHDLRALSHNIEVVGNLDKMLEYLKGCYLKSCHQVLLIKVKNVVLNYSRLA